MYKISNEDIITNMYITDPDLIESEIEGVDGSKQSKANDNISTAIANGTNIGNGLSIVDYLTNVNYSNRYNPKKYLVVHYTAGTVDNGTAARNNAEWFKNTNRGSSAHFFVDSGSRIYRVVNEDTVAWHCGTSGKYYHLNCRNSCAIGVELCSYKDSNGTYKFKQETYDNALTLCRYLVKKYNIPKENVLMHYHVTHKVCAAPFMSNGNSSVAWEIFKNAIFFEDNNIIIDNTNNKLTNMNSLGKVYNVGDSTLNLRKEPHATSTVIGKYKSGDIVNIIGVIGEWYKLDNGGYVSSKYIQVCHWSDVFVDNLYESGIITDKEQWSNHSGVLTKGLAIKLISNCIDGEGNNPSGSHYATAAMNNLINKGIINDKSQWEKLLDTPISKAMFLALVDNATGGMLDKYKGRNSDHWGRNCLDSLCDKAIIVTPFSWVDFEAQVQYDIALALIYKLLSNTKR